MPLEQEQRQVWGQGAKTGQKSLGIVWLTKQGVNHNLKQIGFIGEGKATLSLRQRERTV